MSENNHLNLNPGRRVAKGVHAQIPTALFEKFFRVACDLALNGDKEAAQWVMNEMLFIDRETVRHEFLCKRISSDIRETFYGKPCVSCGKPADTIDHIIPVSKGGTNDIENLQPMCWPCNRSKRNH